jgi:hypothetical protein
VGGRLVTADASGPVDVWLVHVNLSRPEDDLPPAPVSVTVAVIAPRTGDIDVDQEWAEQAAVEDLRRYLNNSTHVVPVAVLT